MHTIVFFTWALTVLVCNGASEPGFMQQTPGQSPVYLQAAPVLAWEDESSSGTLVTVVGVSETSITAVKVKRLLVEKIRLLILCLLVLPLYRGPTRRLLIRRNKRLKTGKKKIRLLRANGKTGE